MYVGGFWFLEVGVGGFFNVHFMENSGGWNGSLGVSFVYLVCVWISYVGWLGEGWVFG